MGIDSLHRHPNRFLCELLEKLKIILGGSADTVIIAVWFNERSSVIPRQGHGAIAFLLCLLPKQRPDRVFGLQERQLENIIHKKYATRQNVTTITVFNQAEFYLYGMRVL